jgi:dolichyl-phosphate-mannose-protein mannosyltransferase
MKRRDLVLAGVLFLLAFGLRILDLDYPRFMVLDEPGNVPAATHYWNDGQFEPDVWEHPPLRHVTLYGFIQLLGDNPYGWRMRNVLFGALAAALTYLFALEVTGLGRAALLAGLLLATDPLHVVLSRYTYEEVYGGAFFLGALVLHVRHRQRSLWLALSAVLMGCALATKWYYVPCWALLGALTLREHGNFRDPRSALFVACTWVFIPLSVYVLSYGPWFGRGYSMPELLEHVLSSYRSLQSMTPNSFQAASNLLVHPSAREWFTAPIVVGQGVYLDAGRGEFVLFVNSLPIWILTLPALLGVTALAWRRRQLTLALPVLFFFASYALLVSVERPVFIYSAAPLLPLAFTAIGFAVTWTTGRLGARLYWIIVAAAMAWNGFLYPLVTAKRVPVAPYRFLLNDKGVRVL